VSAQITQRLAAAHARYLERVSAGHLAAAEREFLNETLHLARLAYAMLAGGPTRPLCAECGAAAALSYSRLCEACYGVAIAQIKQELAPNPMHQLASLEELRKPAAKSSEETTEATP
jgi:hypothetical protein